MFPGSDPTRTMPALTSRHHPIVKEFRELARGGGPRLLLDGWHLVAEAARAGVRLETVAISGTPSPEHQAILGRATGPQTRVVEVSTAVMNALSPVQVPHRHRRLRRAAAGRRVDPARARAGPRPRRRGRPGSGQRRGVDSLRGCRRRHRRRLRPGLRRPVELEGAARRRWAARFTCRSRATSQSTPPSGPGAARALRCSPPFLVAARRCTRWISRAPRRSSSEARVRGCPTISSPRPTARSRIPLSRDIESLNVAVAAALLVFEARRQPIMSLFDDAPVPVDPKTVPLAERMRPADASTRSSGRTSSSRPAARSAR